MTSKNNSYYVYSIDYSTNVFCMPAKLLKLLVTITMRLMIFFMQKTCGACTLQGAILYMFNHVDLQSKKRLHIKIT